MGSQIRQTILVGGVTVLIGALAACGPKSTPPPPPPPPPLPVAYIPPRPQPPLGAAPTATVPPLGPDGVRQTINAHVTPPQAVWNLRSAFNVAALDCQRPEHGDILAAYKLFLKNHKNSLVAANKGVDSDFRNRYGAAFVRPREAYMTQVYNYYAFPPTLAHFCDAALVMARESRSTKPAELTAFSARNLAMLDTVFEGFYRSYDQYRADAAAWDARYSPTRPTAGAATNTMPAPGVR